MVDPYVAMNTTLYLHDEGAVETGMSNGEVEVEHTMSMSKGDIRFM